MIKKLKHKMSLISLFKNVTRETIQSINNINTVVKRMDDKVDEYCENVAKDLSKVLDMEIEVVKIKGVLTKNLIIFQDEEMRRKIEEREERLKQKELELKEREESRKRKIEERKQRELIKEQERKEREQRKQKEREEKELRRQKERELREEKMRQRDQEREEKELQKQKEREEKEAKKRQALEYKNQKKSKSNDSLSNNKSQTESETLDTIGLQELIKGEPIYLSDEYWTFSVGKIKDEIIYLHKKTNIVCLKNDDEYIFKGIRVNNKLVKDKDVVDDIKFWLRDCGFIVESLNNECDSISYSESETSYSETTQSETESELNETQSENDSLYDSQY
jgi:hypothetical protein